MTALLWPRTRSPAQSFSAKVGRAVHWTCTIISVPFLAGAEVALLLGLYQATTNSGEWANDYWFNPDWWSTATWGIPTFIIGVTIYFVGRLSRYALSKE